MHFIQYWIKGSHAPTADAVVYNTQRGKDIISVCVSLLEWIPAHAPLRYCFSRCFALSLPLILSKVFPLRCRLKLLYAPFLLCSWSVGLCIVIRIIAGLALDSEAGMYSTLRGWGGHRA